MSRFSSIKNSLGFFLLLYLVNQSSFSFAQNDVLYADNGTLTITIVENENSYQFSSTQLFAAVNPKLKKLEMRIPQTAILSLDSTELSLFYTVFQIDTLSDDDLAIYIDFPNDEIVLTDFTNKENGYVGMVDFGEFEVKAQTTVSGIYNVEYLLFDFDFLLNAPFEPVITVHGKEVTEVHIYAQGVKVYSKR